jgi:hypothetical protein
VSSQPVYEVDGHEPHRGNHVGYSCGLSGPHCWGCNEPWPCRASRKFASLPPPDEAERPKPLTETESVQEVAARYGIPLPEGLHLDSHLMDRRETPDDH